MGVRLLVLGAVVGAVVGMDRRISSEGDDDVTMDTFTISNLDKEVLLRQFLSTLQNRNVDNAPNPRGLENEESTKEPFGTEESWSILWYFASFSGLIIFFLVISCSEWCCRKHVRTSNIATSSQTVPPPSISATVPETPPPAYDLFAPPSYESLAAAASSGSSHEKSEFDVYVVPVHAIGSMLQANSSANDDEPPSYCAVNMSYIPAEGEGRRSGA